MRQKMEIDSIQLYGKNEQEEFADLIVKIGENTYSLTVVTEIASKSDFISEPFLVLHGVIAFNPETIVNLIMAFDKSIILEKLTAIDENGD